MRQILTDGGKQYGKSSQRRTAGFREAEGKK